MNTNKSSISVRSILSCLMAFILILSTVSISTITVQAAHAPTITTPRENQVVPHANLTVSGSSPSGRAVYIHLRNVDLDRRIDLGSGTGYGGHRISDWGNTYSFTVSLNSLVPGARFRLAIESRGDGPSTWAAVYFTVESLQRPTITTPRENKAVPHADLTVTGNNSAGGAVYIHLRNLDNNQRIDLGSGTGYDGHRIASGGNTFSFTIPRDRLNPGTRYRVFVDTRLGGQAIGSGNRYFTVQAVVALQSPTITAPRENQTVSHANLTVSGNNPSAGAVYIHLRDVDNNRRIDLGSGIGYEGHRISTGGTSFSFNIAQSSLTPGTRYRLVVESRRDGQNAWSNARYFSVQGAGQQQNYAITVDNPIGRGNTIVISYGANIRFPNIVIRSPDANLRAVTINIPHHGDDVQAIRLTNQGREVSLRNQELRTYSGNRRLPAGFHRVNIWARNVDDTTAGEIVCYFYVRVVRAAVVANRVTAPYGQTQTRLNGNVQLPDYNNGNLKLIRFQIEGGNRPMCTMDNDNGVRWQPSRIREIGHFYINTAGLPAGNYTIVVWARIATGMRYPNPEYTSIRAGTIPLTIGAQSQHRRFNCTAYSPGHTFWLQNDARWSGHRYGTHANATTFGAAACGLFATKNALYALDMKVSVDDLHDAAVSSRARRANNGTFVSANLLPYMQRNNMASFDFRRVTNIQTVVNHVSGGGAAIVNYNWRLANGGTGGHFIAIVGVCIPTQRFLIQCSALDNGRVTRGNTGGSYGTWVATNVWTAGGRWLGPETFILISSRTPQFRASAPALNALPNNDLGVLWNRDYSDTEGYQHEAEGMTVCCDEEASNDEQHSDPTHPNASNKPNSVSDTPVSIAPTTNVPVASTPSFNVSVSNINASEVAQSLRFSIGSQVFTRNGVSATLDAASFIDSSTGRTMVPLRAISEGLGAAVNWDNTTRTVTIVRDGTTIKIIVDAPLPNGMGVPAIVNGRTFVPVRYVSEMLGADVRWDGNAHAVYISMVE